MYTLYSFGTPNGFKPTIMLEELKLPYSIQLIDITKGEQFNPDYLKISPNNKIPALYDQPNNFYMFESVAILQYLAEQHAQFLPTVLQDKYTVIQWCYFQAAHIGPMFGQLGHFARYAPEQLPYAIKRYTDECERLLGVLEHQLVQSTYVAGADYTIADMTIWPWIWCFLYFYEQPIDDKKFPALMRWFHQLSERPAMKATLKIYGR